jgi:predicted TIM-barrel fold metal-dependent hydrolase
MFDCNIHLPCNEKGLNERLCDESQMNKKELMTCFTTHLPNFKKNISAGNFMLFNEALTIDDAAYFTSHVRQILPGSKFTALISISSPQGAERIKLLKNAGIDSIKFHCYVQNITDKDFLSVMELAKVAESLGMPIFIDTSYGSVGMYCNDNLKLAAFLLKEISSVPVVLLHSGGARVLEAFLLADACPNVYLETSFSLPFYLGSSVEKDLAFAYKKFPERVIYGSDFPYVSFTESYEKFLFFTDKWKFTQSQIDGFMIQNVNKVFSE